jgi:hypothetical protein
MQVIAYSRSGPFFGHVPNPHSNDHGARTQVAMLKDLKKINFKRVLCQTKLSYTKF